MIFSRCPTNLSLFLKLNVWDLWKWGNTFISHQNWSNIWTQVGKGLLCGIALRRWFSSVHRTHSDEHESFSFVQISHKYDISRTKVEFTDRSILCWTKNICWSVENALYCKYHARFYQTSNYQILLKNKNYLWPLAKIFIFTKEHDLNPNFDT